MLSVLKEKSNEIVRLQREGNRLYLYSEAGIHRLEPKDCATVRITYTQNDVFSDEEKPGIVCRDVFSDWEYTEGEQEICLRMEQLEIIVNRKTASYTYYDGKGNELLR